MPIYYKTYTSLQDLINNEFPTSEFDARRMTHHRGGPTIIAVACGIKKTGGSIKIKSVVFTCSGGGDFESNNDATNPHALCCSNHGGWGSSSQYPYPITLRVLQGNTLLNHHISRFREAPYYDINGGADTTGDNLRWNDDLTSALAGLDRFNQKYCWMTNGGKDGNYDITINNVPNFCIPSELCIHEWTVPDLAFKLYFKCYGSTNYYDPDTDCLDYIQNNPYGESDITHRYYAYGGCYFSYDGKNLYSHDQEPDPYTAPSNLSLTITNVTGTTITAKVSWTDGSNAISAASVSCSNGTTKQVSNGGSVIFTGLTNGNSYTITTKINDGAGKGSGVSELSATVPATTYKVNFGTSSSNTRKISVSASANQGNKNLKYKIDAGSNQGPISSGSTISKDGLTHGTKYTIYCWIDGMVDNNGSLDTVAKIEITTKTLTLINISASTTQFSAASSWQAKANNIDYNESFLSFILSKCNATKPEATFASGSTAGTYKNLSHTGLESYTNYILRATVSDGYNEASATVTVKTQFPYIRIYDGTKWRKAMPYIYDGTTWKLAKPMGYNGSLWKECNYN